MKHTIILTAVAVAAGLLSSPVAESSSAQPAPQSTGAGLFASVGAGALASFAGNLNNPPSSPPNIPLTADAYRKYRAAGRLPSEPSPGDPDFSVPAPGMGESSSRGGGLGWRHQTLRDAYGFTLDPCLERDIQRFNFVEACADALEDELYHADGAYDPTGTSNLTEFGSGRKYHACFMRTQLSAVAECLRDRRAQAYERYYGTDGDYLNGLLFPPRYSNLGHCETCSPLPFPFMLPGTKPGLLDWMNSPNRSSKHKTFGPFGDEILDGDLRGATGEHIRTDSDGPKFGHFMDY
jgi:hypothetical protein